MKHILLSLLLAISVFLSFPTLGQAGLIVASAQVSTPAIAKSTSQSSSEQLVERLEKIKARMQKLRFCYNDNCFYRNIESKITPPESDTGKYTAVISAIIDRPSTVLDTADYTFAFIDNHWQLLKGEEYTDVAEYAFKGDRYEIFSVHTSRVVTGTLAQAKADGNLKSGYLPLYYDILDKGIEKETLTPSPSP
jgi:hypothetical protein